MSLLTPRQRMVMQLIAAGFSDKEIADMLGIGTGSVKTYTSAIYRALGFPRYGGNRVRLALLYWEACGGVHKLLGG